MIIAARRFRSFLVSFKGLPSLSSLGFLLFRSSLLLLMLLLLLLLFFRFSVFGFKEEEGLDVGVVALDGDDETFACLVVVVLVLFVPESCW